jgi:hypothetical protein
MSESCKSLNQCGRQSFQIIINDLEHRLKDAIPTGMVILPTEPTVEAMEAMSAYADDLSKYRALSSLYAGVKNDRT